MEDELLISNTPSSLLIVTIGEEKVYLDVEEKLGEGAFGTVSRAVDNRGVSFAIKRISCRDINTYESIAQEVEILLKLKHSNIVEMYGFDFFNSTAVLIMEYCSEGTLNTRLDTVVDVMVQLQWMEQLASALAYLHDSNIVHRDLKTENVLLSGTNDVKIADFGIARHFICCKSGQVDDNPNNYISKYLDTYMGTFAGTPFWIAPEVFDHNYTEKADIFSLGVIFHAICERTYCTFNGERYYGTFVKYRGTDTGIGLVMYEQQQMIEPPFHDVHNKIIKHIITSMLSFNPQTRISLMDLRGNINDAYLDVLQVNNKQPELEYTVHNGDNATHINEVHIDVIEEAQHSEIDKLRVHCGEVEKHQLNPPGGCQCSWCKWIICCCRCTCGYQDGEYRVVDVHNEEPPTRCTCPWWWWLIRGCRCTCGYRDFLLQV